MPALSMLTAAFTSRSCTVAQLSHSHFSRASGFERRSLQTEQSCDVYAALTFTSHLPAHAAL